MNAEERDRLRLHIDRNCVNDVWMLMPPEKVLELLQQVDDLEAQVVKAVEVEQVAGGV